eukprot:scaffold12110_cov58-Cyclotella_meneghiniana.AAC.4
MVSKSTTSTRRNPDRAKFLSSSHPMPPEPMRSIREVKILVRRGGGRAACRPVRIGGIDGGVSSSAVVLVMVFQ